MQTRALVRLGANACIVGRNVEKTEEAAKDIATVRPGAKVIGIGGCDVRKVRASDPQHSQNRASIAPYLAQLVADMSVAREPQGRRCPMCKGTRRH
jgi:NAD(P)-dependent dehydrogenase (short-subunit alcohol dehydrogenase family)